MNSFKIASDPFAIKSTRIKYSLISILMYTEFQEKENYHISPYVDCREGLEEEALSIEYSEYN